MYTNVIQMFETTNQSYVGGFLICHRHSKASNGLKDGLA